MKGRFHYPWYPLAYAKAMLSLSSSLVIVSLTPDFCAASLDVSVCAVLQYLKGGKLYTSLRWSTPRVLRLSVSPGTLAVQFFPATLIAPIL
jgi:hypothetical protein